MYGFTDNYIKVAVPFNGGLVNTIQETELEAIIYGGNVKGAAQ